MLIYWQKGTLHQDTIHIMFMIRRLFLLRMCKLNTSHDY